jgi:hypothetical protein
VKARLFVHLGEELHEHVVGRTRITLGRRTTVDVLVPDNLASRPTRRSRRRADAGGSPTSRAATGPSSASAASRGA